MFRVYPLPLPRKSGAVWAHLHVGRTMRIAMMPACQPPLGAPAAFPPRAVQSGLLPAAAGRASRVDSLLLAVFNEEDVRGELLSAMSLQSKRASCCCCSTLRSCVSADLHAPSLAVCIEDANLHNAAFVVDAAHAAVVGGDDEGEGGGGDSAGGDVGAI